MKANGIRWSAAIVGIMAIALMCISFVPSHGLVGGASATVANNPRLSGSPVAQPAVKASVHPHASSPHPGTLEIWEVASGGAPTVDPAVAYYTVDFEPILNVYQTLIQYNGSSDGPTPDQYVPQLATCVPGSNECVNQFGNNLVYANATTGNPEYYTFEIDGGAHFYDPATHAGWGVYPSDVLFSLARTMAWSDLPGVGVTNGWILTQSLTHVGNRNWDSGYHFPYNNTPQGILKAFLINDSTYCPTSSIVATNGCLTVDVGASGFPWPYFLELVADGLGGSVVPCGIFTQNGAAMPGFTGTTVANGDGPCLLPGGAKSSSDAGYQNYITSTAPTAWDTFEKLAIGSPNVQAWPQHNETGSGPYYINNPVDPSVGYTLHANPDYAAPVGCAGQTGCEPIAGKYQPTVQVVWEQTGDTQGLNEMAAGQADSAGFSTSDTGLVQNYVSSGTYYLITGLPTLTIGFDPFTLNFSVTAEAGIDNTGNLNIPSTFFSNLAVREFLVNAYPYKTIDSTIDTVNGIQFAIAYGGAIPHYMGPYYPGNVTWPAGNPTSSPSTPGNVTWWWHEAITPGTPWYNAQAAACTSGTPCKWAMDSVSGAPALDQQFDDWISEINTLSGGALQPYRIDITGGVLVGSLGSAPGTSPLTEYNFGWAPDYPDPTDYAAPIYYPDNSYTYSDALAEALAARNGTNPACPTNYGAFSNLATYAGMSQLPDNCQASAYLTLNYWQQHAAHLTDVSQRILIYNMVEHIANDLALYVYDAQSVGVADAGSWIAASTINTNPTIGGGGDQLWYDWGYASNYFNVIIAETGLPVGSAWSATFNGATTTSTSASIEFPGVLNGTYGWSVSAVTNYLSSPSSGSITVAGADVTQATTYTHITGPTWTLTVSETGLPASQNWTVVAKNAAGAGSSVTGAVAAGGSSLTLSLVLPQDNYTITPTGITGYTPTPVSYSNVNLNANTTESFTYAVVTHIGYTVTFTETGLPSGQTWQLSLNGQLSAAATTSTITFTGIPNGNYTWGVIAIPTGYTVSPPGGRVVVNGAAPAAIALTLTAPPGGGGGTTSSWTSLSTLAYAIIGALAVLVVIFIALAAMYAGRKPPSAPESWSGGGSSSSSTDTTGDNKSGGM